jgi:hypothetical protein
MQFEEDTILLLIIEIVGQPVKEMGFMTLRAPM